MIETIEREPELPTGSDGMPMFKGIESIKPVK